ncbi:MAG TPA: glycosyltransferase family 9 protein [Candidatus Methylacidiphilales bacterium]
MRGAAAAKRLLLRLASARAGGEPASAPRKIFVHRCNDLGDLLVVTPLFEALRRLHPQAEIVAGVGPWAAPLLEGNPHVDRVELLRTPWHNKAVPDPGILGKLAYLRDSADLRRVRAERYDLGIDVTGSFYGALFLIRAGIPRRVGVEGYAGGDGGYTEAIAYDPALHVGAAALRLAGRLGLPESAFPENCPRLFPTGAECAAAEASWKEGGAGPRIVLAPGAGFPAKAWPVENYRELAALLAAEGANLAVVGGPGDAEEGSRIALAAAGRGRNLAGTLSLRGTAALVAGADFVFCNSSMAMHAAAAFGKPAFVLLGPIYPSARAHMAQWGYPGLSHVMGREDGGPLPTAREVHARYRDLVLAREGAQ